MSPAPFPSFTETWHSKSYPAINSARPELSAKGKVVVITGGAGSIGSAMALAFARASAKVIILTGRTEKTLIAAKASVTSDVIEANIQYYVSDVTDAEGFAAAMGDVNKVYGPIDVFVSNAGYLSTPEPIANTDYDEWWKSFDVNIRGSFNAIRAFLPNSAKENAVLFNVTTGIAVIPSFPSVSAYAASKVATAKLFEAVQTENPGVHVLNIHPGVVDSTLNKKSFIPGMDDAQLPGDFAVWAASPEARFLRGRFVYVNWDVEEMKARAAEFEENPFLLTIALEGNSSKGWNFQAA